MTIKKKILVVDDQKMNRVILCKILQTEGYETLEAENGQAALALLQDNNHKVDLMLLDVLMPVMDGYEVLKKMNETKIITSVPVIVTTGNDDPDAEIHCLESGASDFIKKPYNVELVRHRVQSILRLYDNAALISKLETDRLTGIYSREFFYRHAEELLEGNPDKDFYLIYADVADFKMVNAHHGTAMGDTLLKFLASVFHKYAGQNGICGRLGGDTFGLLLDNCPKRTQEEVRAFNANLFMDAPIKGFQVKYGIYPITDRHISILDMCDCAKLALKSVKNQYGMYFAVYDSSIMKKAIREHMLADCMEEALAKKQFVVYLQPKHSTETGAVAGAEVLVRWNHPELGFIAPGEFIPLFERNGFVTKLDAYMLKETCCFLKDWRDRGIPAIPISVNVSRADFISENLPEKIEGCVDSYGIPHELIHLEVTESAYTDNPQEIITAVSSLRKKGFLIEMDDFGSGYSSLNMLSELPIDTLKLDMRFMQSGNDLVKGGKRNILSFIISLSKWLRLSTVAEGVETKEEFDLLKTMGCNLIQGYYFAKPMPIKDFEKYMQDYQALCKVPKPDGSDDMISTILSGDTEKPLILMAENTESDQANMKELLSLSYRVAIVENGEAVCEYLFTHGNEVSCLLLNLLVPDVDGFHVLEFMHTNGMMNEIPVVVMVETGSESEMKALRLGVDYFVSKSDNPEIILHHVRKAVEEKEFWKIRKEFNSQSHLLYEKAYEDELTGLANRHGLREVIDEMPTGKRYAALMLDIDNLKKINDTGGHAVGDKVIRTVAETLRSVIRAGDFIARTGGDEFMILLFNMDDSNTVLSKGEQICEKLKQRVIADTNFHPVCSMGITLASQAEHFEAVSRRADMALYRAKKTNKGGCCLWSIDAADEDSSRNPD